jgi:formate hydrogenlyase subunit 6/NADH:ubiquinone oxidoreductase subunit I
MVKLDPQSTSRPREKSKKIIAVEYGLCHYCGACVAVCPADALFLTDAHLEVKDSCTGCGQCAKVCPAGALAAVDRETP